MLGWREIPPGSWSRLTRCRDRELRRQLEVTSTLRGSFTETSQGIHRLTVQNVGQLPERPVRGKLRFDDGASNLFRVFDDPRRSSNGRPADHGIGPDEVGRFWSIIHPGVSK